ncbi:unnamed protein product [Thelazia callipaeda]|uniref:VASt domain-containing protein n=1 Tax=Thelazia callipaeda TaxID=103827 RepID=A0A0N5CZP8_THECL|nr:unnamed protein product [Thelazia callipaeda]
MITLEVITRGISRNRDSAQQLARASVFAETVLGGVNETCVKTQHMFFEQNSADVAQQCYQDITRLEKKSSTWKANIEKKISENNLHKTFKERYLAGEVLECENLKEAEKWNSGPRCGTRKWGTMHDEYLEEFVPDSEVHYTFPSEAEFWKIVSCLPNWKLADSDGIYNFIKCTSLYPDLYKITRWICLDGEGQDPWFYKGTTYLILKMSQTKLDIATRKLLGDNQLGTVGKVQGAEEQAFFNLAVCREHGKQLFTT